MGKHFADDANDRLGRHFAADEQTDPVARRPAVGRHWRAEESRFEPRLLGPGDVLRLSGDVSSIVASEDVVLPEAAQRVDREPIRSKSVRSVRWATAIVATTLLTLGAGQVSGAGVSSDAQEVAPTTVTALSTGPEDRSAGNRPSRGEIVPTSTLAPTTTVVATTVVAVTAAPAPKPSSPSTTRPKPKTPQSTTVVRRQATTASGSTCSTSKAAAEVCWGGLINQYSWDYQTAVNIMWCESRGNPDARNPRSTATGLFQILGGPTDPHANVAQAHQMYLRRGWQPWVCKG